MGKRTLNAAEDVQTGDEAYQKRQKIAHHRVDAPASVEEIQSARQLQQLLVFDQDIKRSRHGIQSFKIFLDGFHAEDIAKQKSILKEYLQSQIPADPSDENALFMNDVVQTWSFASQSNNDSLLSAVPALLALLLKTISNHLEFTEYGLHLCKTLLQKRPLELVARGLTANTNKDFVISPALRLLKEVASFDGGVVIKQVFRQREHTFKSLGRNLGLGAKPGVREDSRRPSVRTNAVRFVLTCIRLLPAEGKEKNELCQMKDVAGLIRSINLDPPALIEDILKTLTTSIIQDKHLSRDAKKKVLNSASLSRIVSLYGFQYIPKEGEATIDVEKLAHEFLIAACTTPDIGILHRQRGFYPMGVDADDTRDLEGSHNSIDLGLGRISWANKSYRDKVPVQNTILSNFIKPLRPWSSLKQSELILTIFKAAPELVADYFFSKKDFSFDPKLTATWMGYSAMIFAAVSTPLPEFFGYRSRYANLPPPTSIVIESIIPAPVNQKALTKCLTNKSDLIKFLGIRLLTVAFKKLREALAMYSAAASIGHSQIWNEAKERLINEFCERCPTMQDAFSAFKNIPETNLLQREAITNLLVLYYEIVPQVALDAKLDVSGSLIEALELSKKERDRKQDVALQAMITEHLFQVSNYSPAMRWFAKLEPLKLSPFVAMIQQALSATPDSKLYSLLQSIATENQILQSVTQLPSANALVASLKFPEAATDGTFEFLDNCILRCTTTPIKYFDQLEDIYLEVYGKKDEEKKVPDSPVSLLLIVVLEQWPFVVKSQDDSKMQSIARFISYYLAASLKIEEDKKILKVLTKRLVDVTPADSTCRKILDRSRKQVDVVEIPEHKPLVSQEQVLQATNIKPEEETAQIIHDLSLGASKFSVEDNSALTRWTSKAIEEVIEDGHAAALVALLSSPTLSIRKEAMTNLAKLAAKLKESSFEEKEQIWLLLCELMETSRDKINDHPVSTFITAFAAEAIAVLVDPLHCIYPKINKFLTKGPTWAVNKLPLMRGILHDRPSLDNAYSQEVEWLLKYMILGLRTKEDMSVYHSQHVFEKLLSLYNNPYNKGTVREKILQLFLRAINVEGGSDTLITRFSGLTWLSAQKCMEGNEETGKKLGALLEELGKKSDGKRVKKWMRGEKKGEVLEGDV